MRTTLPAAVLVLALPTAALAHGELRPGRGAAGVELDATLLVPSERDGHDSAGIALSVPPGFEPLSCRAPVGWTCSARDRGFTWQRITGVVQAADFELTMRTGSTPGTYTFPLAQTYDDGVTNTFAGAPGTRDEAPVFTVTGGGTAPTAGASASAAPRPSVSAGRSLRPSVQQSAPSASAAATTSGSPAGVASVPASAGAASASPAAELALLPPGRRLEPPSGGGGATVPIALVGVGLTALAGAVLVLRRRRSDEA